ncbi:MAG: SulP family inorganic anion transporter [Phycisphaerales bacterium]
MSHETTARTAPAGPAPAGNLKGFVAYMPNDVLSGFFVFLIALPLCLGISLASGFPPVAGVMTAVIGSMVTSMISNSELTIKGPAAGLIVIVLGAMNSFGFTGGADPAADAEAYRMTLAVGCVAGVLQLGFGLLKAGAIGEFFPTTVVHGMLAAIGLTIGLKQLPVVFGEKAGKEPLGVIRDLPKVLADVNPGIAVIGLTSLAILFLYPYVRPRLRPAWLRMVPAQMLVILVGVPLGIWFDLAHEHTYTFRGHEYPLGESFLVNVPGNLVSAITFPDFGVFAPGGKLLAAIGWVLMFALVGSLESLLSAKAIDLLDPWKRKTQFDRDLVAVGTANVAAAAVGGLPMISEIVRSKANIDNGARTRFADVWHGVFLLAFVALAPGLMHRIPLAALAAMLVHTGYRLASPSEFAHMLRVGPEQLLVFVSTIVGVLATDLLVGVGIGIAVKIGVHAMNGVPVRSLLKPYLEVVEVGRDTVQINARGSAVFTNWIPFRREIERLGLVQRQNVIVNLSGTRLVDHSVMEKLHEVGLDFAQAGLRLEVVGLEAHRGISAHPRAARKRIDARMQFVCAWADASSESALAERMRASGFEAWSTSRCERARAGESAQRTLLRVEATVPADVAARFLAELRGDTGELAGVEAVATPVEAVGALSGGSSQTNHRARA